MEILDIFSGDAFTMASLTNTINHLDFKPAVLRAMGIFDEEGVPTRTVIIEEEFGTLRLVPTAEWGGVGSVSKIDKRKSRSFIVPHLPTRDAITAEEVQNVRAYAQNMTPQQALLAIEQLRDKKLVKMRDDLEVTLEHHAIGAVKGTILDSDGSTVIFNLFTEFAVTQQTHNMVLDTGGTIVIIKAREAIRKSLTALGNQPITGWAALCGDSFFDKLTGHGNVEKHFLNWEAARAYSEQHRAYGAFPYAGVNWLNYRGSIGGVDFVPTTKAYLFPLGARGLFMTKFGPSDYIDRVNQIPSPDGVPIEVRAEMKPMGKGLDMEAQSNPLYLCTKPRAVIELKENT